MENYSDNIHKFQIPVVTSPTPNMTNGYGFVHQNGNTRTLGVFPQFDFYLPVFITKTGNLMEYVNVDSDDTIFTMERQEINPYFIEFKFFDTIKRNKINNASELTTTMITYIRSVRPEVSVLFPSDSTLKNWFDNQGKFDFAWNKGGSGETTIDSLTLIGFSSDTTSFINENIISKAKRYNIDINK